MEKIIMEKIIRSMLFGAFFLVSSSLWAAEFALTDFVAGVDGNFIANEPVLGLESGYQHTCMYSASSLYCFGSHIYGESPRVIGAFKNLRQISLGLHHTCALEEDGVWCYGNDGSGQVTDIPLLKNPRLIAAGGYHNCVLDDEGVKCWGAGNLNQLNVPGGLINPRLIAAGLHHTCALDDEGVLCWGDNSSGQTRTPWTL